MQALKVIFIVIDFIVCLALIVITMMQAKEDGGLSGSIAGSSTNNFLEKNKGRTNEGKVKKATIILAISFGVLTIATSIIYAI